ncbi:hypothetical protein P7K49_033954, partial [Saguinus oedipus]
NQLENQSFMKLGQEHLRSGEGPWTLRFPQAQKDRYITQLSCQQTPIFYNCQGSAPFT